MARRSAAEQSASLEGGRRGPHPAGPWWLQTSLRRGTARTWEASGLSHHSRLPATTLQQSQCQQRAVRCSTSTPSHLTHLKRLYRKRELHSKRRPTWTALQSLAQSVACADLMRLCRAHPNGADGPQSSGIGSSTNLTTSQSPKFKRRSSPASARLTRCFGLWIALL